MSPVTPPDALRPLRVTIGGERIALFPGRNDSPSRVYFKALALARYRPRFPDCQPGERLPWTRGRHAPCVGAVDLEGEPALWVACGPPDLEELAHVLRHTRAEVAVFLQADLDRWIRSIRKATHFRYTTGRLTLVGFPEDLPEWGDPDRLDEILARATFHPF